MPMYRVTSAHRETGVEVVNDIPATSPAAAAQLMLEQGHLIHTVAEAPPEEPNVHPLPPAREPQPDDSPLFAWAVLLPPVGLIAGGVRMALGKPGGGAACFAALVGLVGWGLLFWIARGL
jgi:hypothetical protein